MSKSAPSLTALVTGSGNAPHQPKKFNLPPLKSIFSKANLTSAGIGAGVMLSAKAAAGFTATTLGAHSTFAVAGITAGFMGAAAGGKAYWDHYKKRCDEALEKGEPVPFFILDRERLKKEGLKAAFQKASWDTVGLKLAGKKALKSAAITFGSALAVVGADELLKHIPQDFFSTIFKPVKEFFSNFIPALRTPPIPLPLPAPAPQGAAIETPEAPILAEAVPEAPQAPEIPLPAPEAVEALLEHIDTAGWSDQAFSDLEHAKRGAPWAIQNIAHYAANGVGMPVNLDVAESFAKIGVGLDNPAAEQFLSDLQKVREHSAPLVTPNAAEHLDAVVPDVPAPDVSDPEIAASAIPPEYASAHVCKVGGNSLHFNIFCANPDAMVGPGETLILQFPGQAAPQIHTLSASSARMSVSAFMSEILERVQNGEFLEAFNNDLPDMQTASVEP